MALPLLPLYYGLLVIISLLFFNYYNHAKFIEGSSKIIETITEQTEHLKDTVLPYVEEYSEIVSNHFHVEPEVKESNKLLLVIKNSNLVKTFCEVYQKASVYVHTFLNNYPSIESTVAENAALAEKYAKIVYDNLSEKGAYIIDQEPIKSYLVEYCKLHEAYVTPYVEATSEFVGGYVEKAVSLTNEKLDSASFSDKSEVRYMIFVIIGGVFVLRFTLMKALKCFAKDAFQMNKNVTDMYKEHQLEELHNPVHNEVYNEIKETSLSDFHMTVDELEDLPPPGSNRSPAAQAQAQAQVQEKEKPEETLMAASAKTSHPTTATSTTAATAENASVHLDRASVRSLLV